MSLTPDYGAVIVVRLSFSLLILLHIKRFLLYAMEEPWTKATNPYSFKPEGDCISIVKRIFADIFN